MNKIITSATWSFFVLCILNGILVIAKESYSPLKMLMADLSGHHWVTHGIVILVVYPLLTMALLRFCRVENSAGNDVQLSNRVIQGVIIGVLLITGFYILH